MTLAEQLLEYICRYNVGEKCEKNLNIYIEVFMKFIRNVLFI